MQQKRKESMDFKKKTVLIVEDNQDTQSTIRLMLNQIGVRQVSAAKNGKEAVVLLGDNIEDQPFDLILCDWNMPNMSGVELLRRVRSANSTVPFLMITARGDADSINKAKESGVSGYILKPFSLQQLEKKMLSVC
jgi:two-component system chemotaxis response regulator CheY